MIKISKSSPPDGLVELQRQAEENHLNPEDVYKTLVRPLRQTVLESLIKEQGHLCAYCMRRIPDERALPPDTSAVSLEHWFPRNPDDGNDRGQGLDYQNMLAVCAGNRGIRHTRKPRDLTCDAKRNNRHLTVNPTNEATLSTIYYTAKGEIHAHDSVIDNDLTVTLNLNCQSDMVRLPENRMNALAPIEKELSECISNEDFKSSCLRMLDVFSNESDPKTPYVGIIIWYLQDTLQNLDD